MRIKIAIAVAVFGMCAAVAHISNFQPVLAKILVHEGGWNYCDKRDPGSCTLNGITEGRWRVYLKEEGRDYEPLGPHLLKTAQWKTDRETIYERYYAGPCGFHNLPLGVDYVVLDYCVNSGVGRGGRALRCGVQVGYSMRDCMRVSTTSRVDGPIIEAATIYNRRQLIKSICDEREGFLRSLATFRTFGVGWMARLRSVCRAGYLMAEGKSASGMGIAPARGPGKAWETDQEDEGD